MKSASPSKFAPTEPAYKIWHQQKSFLMKCLQAYLFTTRARQHMCTQQQAAAWRLEQGFAQPDSGTKAKSDGPLRKRQGPKVCPTGPQEQYHPL